MADKATQKWKGRTDGVTSEWTLYAKIKPDQIKTIRATAETIRDQFRQKVASTDLVISVGTVHDYRWVLFDDDRQIMFTSNFDGDWGAYIDDFFAVGVGKGFDEILSHCEGYPDKSASTDAKKEWLQAHTKEAVAYTRAYRGTVKEIWKALEVQKAFQQVLDDPAAAKALENPALKPLLDQAAT